MLGIIGGSSLFHAEIFKRTLETEKIVDTEYGKVVVYTGEWKKMKIVFCQRHEATVEKTYQQPSQIQYQAILLAMQKMEVKVLLGLYSVGSMDAALSVGRLVIPDDFFNPFHILKISSGYEAHVVPELNGDVRKEVMDILNEEDVCCEGTYVQSSGPRFETKSEIRFFQKMGNIIGMTGAHEAGLANELKIPFCMLAIVDNFANGIGSALTLDNFKIAQKQNAHRMENAVTKILNELDYERIIK